MRILTASQFLGTFYNDIHICYLIENKDNQDISKIDYILNDKEYQSITAEMASSVKYIHISKDALLAWSNTSEIEAIKGEYKLNINIYDSDNTVIANTMVAFKYDIDENKNPFDNEQFIQNYHKHGEIANQFASYQAEQIMYDKLSNVKEQIDSLHLAINSINGNGKVVFDDTRIDKLNDKVIEYKGAVDAMKADFELMKDTDAFIGKNGKNGKDGKDGISPTIKVVEDEDGETYHFTITDKDGEKHVDIKRGSKGGVTSFNGRKGDIIPQLGDYDVEKIGVLDDNGEPILKENGKPMNVLEYMNAHFEVKKTDAQKEAEQKKSEVDLSNYYTKEETLESVRNEIGTITYDDKEEEITFTQDEFERGVVYNDGYINFRTVDQNSPDAELSTTSIVYLPCVLKNNSVTIQHDLEELYIIEIDNNDYKFKRTKVANGETYTLSNDTYAFSFYIANCPDKCSISCKVTTGKVTFVNKLLKNLDHYICYKLKYLETQVQRMMGNLYEVLSEALKVNIINNLLSDDEDSALSAKQGKILNDKIEALHKKQIMTSSGDVTISPSTFYVWNDDVATLNIAFDNANSDTFIQEYHFMFNSGSTATALTLPTSVKKPSDFQIEANKVYEISILENCLSYQSWGK